MVHLIDKDALVTKLKKRIKDYWSDSENTMGIYPYALEEVIKYINTLEVKEVDLEEELIKWHKQHFKKDGTFIGMSGFYLTNNSQMDIAKHFFELGLRSTITEEDCKLIWNIGDEIPNRPEEEFFKELLRRYKAHKG